MCGFCSRANNPAQTKNPPVLVQSLSNAATGAWLVAGDGVSDGPGVSSGGGGGVPTFTVCSATSSCEPAAER